MIVDIRDQLKSLILDIAGSYGIKPEKRELLWDRVADFEAENLAQELRWRIENDGELLE